MFSLFSFCAFTVTATAEVAPKYKSLDLQESVLHLKAINHSFMVLKLKAKLLETIVIVSRSSSPDFRKAFEIVLSDNIINNYLAFLKKHSL